MKDEETDEPRYSVSSFILPPSSFPSWGVGQARLKPLDFQSRDAWVRIPHALPILLLAVAQRQSAAL